jgi:hypothetical protein
MQDIKTGLTNMIIFFGLDNLNTGIPIIHNK